MFDDFMHNDFPEMHLNQAHQDAMLHAQNQAMNQAAQQGAFHRPPEPQPRPPEPIPPAGTQNAAMNFRLLLQAVTKRLSTPK